MEPQSCTLVELSPFIHLPKILMEVRVLVPNFTERVAPLLAVWLFLTVQPFMEQQHHSRPVAAMTDIRYGVFYEL